MQRALPLGGAARKLPDGMELALGGGEDYALLLSIPRRKLPEPAQAASTGRGSGASCAGKGIQLTELGPAPARFPPPGPASDHLK